MGDPLDRLTPLAVMVLALLAEGDMHPYEMMRLLRQRRDDRLVPITNGTMYHTVARLEAGGLLAETGTDRDGNRPERTTYSRTDTGRDAVEEWVRRELSRIDRAAHFGIALAEAHNLDRSEVIDLLSARQAALSAARLEMGEGRAEARERGVPEQFLLEVEREELLADAELHWLDGLIARLQRHEFTWGSDELPPHSERYLLDRKAARL